MMLSENRFVLFGIMLTPEAVMREKPRASILLGRWHPRRKTEGDDMILAIPDTHV